MYDANHGNPLVNFGNGFLFPLKEASGERCRETYGSPCEDKCCEKQKAYCEEKEQGRYQKCMITRGCDPESHLDLVIQIHLCNF